MLMRYTLIFVLVLLAGAAAAQSSKKSKKKGESNSLPRSEPSSPTSLDPTFPQKDYTPKKTTKKKTSGGPTYESEREYYDRMAQLDKTRKKNERYADTPQYTDPTYFGHKHPPKKRPPGKMKYCKVCGIRH